MNGQNQDQRWWAKAILVGGVIGLACITIGALGTKFGLWTFTIGLGLFALGGALGFLGTALGLIALIVTFSKKLPAARASVSTGLVLCAVIAGVFGSQFFTASTVPPIHNVSTDTNDPPVFDQIVVLRGETSNPLDYTPAIAEQQRGAYPDLQPLITATAPGEMFNRAKGVLESMGLEIVNANADAGVIEATATTFWMGFKDDVVVRVRPSEAGSVVDIRSVSRVGKSDIGVNAKRIRTIIAGLKP
jgi:uncharacterized protein (DUF1499 family)